MTPPRPPRAPRILAGRFRGRSLVVPTGRVTRPARVLVRRSLFDILGPGIEDRRWLDLYAGSGSLGIEALSRGAAHATFIEAGAAGRAALRRNLQLLGLQPPEAILLPQRLPERLLQPPPDGGPFDFVSLDPPFVVCRRGDQLRGLVQALGRAAEIGWLRDEARLLWEEPADAPDPVPPGYREVDRRPFGTSRLRIFRLAPPCG